MSQLINDITLDKKDNTTHELNYQIHNDNEVILLKSDFDLLVEKNNKSATDYSYLVDRYNRLIEKNKLLMNMVEMLGIENKVFKQKNNKKMVDCLICGISCTKSSYDEHCESQSHKDSFESL